MDELAAAQQQIAELAEAFDIHKAAEEELKHHLHTEEALREGEKKFHSIADAAQDAVTMLGSDGRLIYWNPAAERIFGYTKEEAYGKDLHALLMPPRYHDTATKSLKKFWETGTGPLIDKTVETEALHKDGHEFPVEVSISALKLTGKWHAVGLIRDITLRKRAEMQKEQFLHDMGERVKELQCMYGITEALRTCETLVEIFRKVIKKIPPGWHYSDHTKVRIVFDGEDFVEEGFALTEWKQSSDLTIGGICRGSVEVYYTKQFPELDEGPFMKEERNLINGIARTLSEAIERKQAEESLWNSEARFRGLIESSSDWIWEVNMNCVYTYASPRVEAMLGYKPEEVVGKTPFDLMSPEEVVQIAEVFKDVAENGKSIVALENVNLHKNNRRITLETSCVPVFDEGGKVTGFRGINRDITERRDLEEREKRHHTELAHADRMNIAGELATGLAHEINQPLSAITSYAQTCRRLLPARDNNFDGLGDRLEKIIAQAKRASEIIHHLRRFIRLQPADKTVLDLNGLVAKSMQFMLPEARLSHVAIESHLVKQTLPVAVIGIQIDQVLLNLVRNGIDSLVAAGEGEGMVCVETHCQENGLAMVTVRDTGPGLDVDTVKQIFDPFHTTKAKGIGLGLAISRSIIEAHGGRLWAEAPAGGGAVFNFTIPSVEDCTP